MDYCFLNEISDILRNSCKEEFMNINEVGIGVAGNTLYTQQQNNEQAISQTEVVQKAIETSTKEQNTQEEKEKLNELARQLNKELNPLNTNVKFGFSEDIKGLYVTVSERDTDRVIRKIPSDEAMELMAKMREVVGIIFNKQA